MISQSYLNQRRALGILGITLPFLVLFFGKLGQNSPGWFYSISATFYTNAAPVFIAIMGAVGLFLVTYDLYSTLDRVINKLSGLFALVVAFIPCGATKMERVGLLYIPVKVSAVIHNISAAVFFLLLAFNILFLFTKSSGHPTPEKLKRNVIYRFCGIGILAFIIIQIITSIAKLDGPYTLINEAGMLLCFGIAWLIKGETLFKDKPVLPVNRP